MYVLFQQKQRCEALEELLVDLIIVGMEKTETNSNDESLQLIWQHLSSQFIFFILFQFASFQHMVLSLHSKVRNNFIPPFYLIDSCVRCGRDTMFYSLRYYYINKKECKKLCFEKDPV